MRILLSLVCVLLISSFTTPQVEAQQRTMQMRAATAQVDTRFSQAFQQAMESGNYRQAGALIGQNGLTTQYPQSSASNRLAVSAGGAEPADYTCNSGNCACAGASDCVAMAPICAEGTIGCNDYGCTCQEA